MTGLCHDAHSLQRQEWKAAAGKVVVSRQAGQVPPSTPLLRLRLRACGLLPGMS